MDKIILKEEDAFEYFNLRLVVPKEVYSPSDDTDLSLFFLKQWVDNIEQSPLFPFQEKHIQIFDMGVGSGILSLYLISRLKAKGFIPYVYGVDINPIAVQTAQFNAKLNDLENYATFLTGKFFNPLKSIPPLPPFDFIISNPPYLAGEPKTINEANRQWIDYAWEGGIQGYEVTLNYLAELSPYLKPQGDFMLISSSNIDQTPILGKIADLNIDILKTHSTHIFFEDILLYHGRKRA